MAAKVFQVIRRTFEVLALLILIVAVIRIAREVPTWDVIFSVLLQVATAVIAWLFSLVADGLRQRQVLKNAASVERPVDVVALKRDVDQQGAMSLERAQLFASLLIHPADYFLRIAESANPMEGHTTVSSKYTIALPVVNLNESVVLPLMLKDRGVLTDGLKVLNAEGKRLSSVVQRTQIGFLAAVCRSLITAGSDKKTLTQYIREVEPRVLKVLSSKVPGSAIEYLELLDSIYAIRDTSKSPEWIDIIPLYLRELRTRIPILVEVPPLDPSKPLSKDIGGSRTIVRYTVDQDIPLAGKTWDSFRGSKWDDFKRLLRNAVLLVFVVLGVRPNRVLVPLDNADRCQSYHLQCDGPPDLVYLGDQYLDPPMDGSTWEFKPRRGQSYSHLYVQDGQQYKGRHFESVFYEIPPGSTGIAAAVAFAGSFGLAILGLHQLRWSPDPSFGSATLVLGLPGAIAAFVGFGRTAGFLRGSFRARISTIVSLLTALVGLMSVALVTRTTVYSATIVSTDLSDLPPIFIFWLVLFGVQSLNLVSVTSLWIYRAFVYWAAKTSYH